MFTGYLGFAGQEIINSARIYGYTHTANCPVQWLYMKSSEFAGWETALTDQPYNVGSIPDAPWYDPDLPASTRFYGLFSLGIDGLRGSTRTATLTEGVVDGGSIQAGRRAIRQVRARALMIADGEDALEVGLAWLESALDANTCIVHAGTCGEGDLDFYSSQPSAPLLSETTAQYQARMALLHRHVRQAKAISGPLITASYRRDNIVAYEVEFTFAAGSPAIYSDPTTLVVPPTTPSIISDVPYNLVPYPSAQLAAGALVAIRNLVANPSIEPNATGWTAVVGSTISGTAATAYLTSGRDTTIAAEGAAAFRARVLGNGSTAIANARTRIDSYYQVSLTGLAARARISFSLWAGAFILAGASGSVINSITVVAEWRQGTTVLSTTTIGTAAASEYGGKVYSLASQSIPTNADNVRLIARYDVTWSSSSTPANNSDIQMFADAAAVTIP